MVSLPVKELSLNVSFLSYELPNFGTGILLLIEMTTTSRDYFVNDLAGIRSGGTIIKELCHHQNGWSANHASSIGWEQLGIIKNLQMK